MPPQLISHDHIVLTSDKLIEKSGMTTLKKPLGRNHRFNQSVDLSSLGSNPLLLDGMGDP